MDTTTAALNESGGSARNDSPSWRPVGIGALAGLVAGLLLTLLQALARLWLGVAPPSELIGDRIAPLLPVEQFLSLLGFFGGYDQLKQVGIAGPTLGQLALAVVLGMLYARLAVRSGGTRRATRTLIVTVAVLFVVLIAALWPVLATSHSGLSPSPSRWVTILVLAVTLALFTAAVVLTVRWVHGAPQKNEPPGAASSVTRRAVLAGGVGAGLAIATGGVGTVLYRQATFSYDGMQLNGPGITPITPNESFYVVTKNVIDPKVRASVWRLSIGGAVARPMTYGFDDLRGMASVTQEATLTCISNAIGGGLQSNAMWVGVPMRDLISEAGPEAGVVEVLLRGVDNFTDTFAIEKAMEPTTLVAYQMNGEPLPERHGFPARVIVPGLFGEKNVKWVTRIDLVTEETKGFYEQQGWGPSFVVPTVSRFTEPGFDRPLTAGAPVTLRGTAFAGNRGVSGVEVSVDDGAAWQPAQLEYSGSPLAWVLWRYEWRPDRPGEYPLLVRATDGAGAPQIAEQRSSVPEGATGYHRVMARVEA
ncbi:MAG: molybdopterin-dependent oxidoreductase [Actinomycetota bacterium]|nr:molybdopterin-dependent oxidoreductase [Actinomycetota bacterium]